MHGLQWHLPSRDDISCSFEICILCKRGWGFRTLIWMGKPCFFSKAWTDCMARQVVQLGQVEPPGLTHDSISGPVGLLVLSRAAWVFDAAWFFLFLFLERKIKLHLTARSPNANISCRLVLSETESLPPPLHRHSPVPPLPLHAQCLQFPCRPLSLPSDYCRRKHHFLFLLHLPLQGPPLVAVAILLPRSIFVKPIAATSRFLLLQ